MSHARHAYLPAAGLDALLPLYDPFVKLLGADRVRARLLDQAALLPQHRILDIGCGTGTLLLAIRQRVPAAELTGLDPDPKALARSRRKTAGAAVPVQLDQGFADALPYADASFDRLFSSFMFHHLPQDTKRKLFQEARRVLRPGGSLHLLDFEGPTAQFRGNRLARMLHKSGQLRDNADSRVLQWMREAGFAQVRKLESDRMLLGQVAFYKAELAR